MKIRSRCRAGVPRRLALVAALFPGLVQAGAQTFNTALPVADGTFVFREQFFSRQAGDDPGPADRDLQVTGAVSVLGYGITGDLTLFGAVPYLRKELELSGPGGRRIERDSSGIGDARVFARYTILHVDAPGRSFRVAPFLGVELPTGDDAERDRFGRLPRPLQSGSGSWDPFVGLAVTYQTLAYELDAQLAYGENREANGFEFGDVARLDGSVQYRLWPPELGEGVPGFLYGVLEANLIHSDENEVNGTEDPNSGGTQLFVAPGLQYVTRRWVVEGVVQIPIAQDMNGSALEDDWIARAGFRFNF